MKHSSMSRLLLSPSLAVFMGFSAAYADAPPDTTLEARRTTILRSIASKFVAGRNYSTGTGRTDCQNMQTDVEGLLARIELKTRGIDATIDASAFPAAAAHIADAIASTLSNRCSFGTSQSPAGNHAYGTLGYILHRHGAAWLASYRTRFQNAGLVRGDSVHQYLINSNIDLAIGHMLWGEVLSNPTLYSQGEQETRIIAEETFAHGGRELHSPLYTPQHFPPLVYGTALRTASGSALSRILLEYELLVEAHHDLPGGGLVPPQSRDYSGGAADPETSLKPTIWALTGDPGITPNASYSEWLSGALHYTLPPAIRDIFLDKRQGYTFWSWSVANQGSTPNAVYQFGDLSSGHRRVNPQQMYALPGGQGGLGLQYGWGGQTQNSSFGAYIRSGDSFAILYQCQPLVIGDTFEGGRPISGLGVDNDPDDWKGETYDFKRMMVGRTAVSIWNTRGQPGATRIIQDTRAHIPDYQALGGQVVRRGLWRVARLGQTYIGYYPLTASTPVETARPGYIHLRLPGPSGFVVEMATTDEFASLDAYANDLASRNVRFTASPLTVEVSAFEPGRSGRRRIRLEYVNEKRFIDGVEQTVGTLNHELMSSPWVETDRAQRRVRVHRGCHKTIEYDWDDAVVRESAADASSCAGGSTLNFSLSNGGAKSVARGASITNTVTATLVSGTAQSTAFSVAGLPSGVTASFAASSCSPTCSTTLTLNASALATVGISTLTVTAAGGGISRTTSFGLTVNAPPPAGSGPIAHWRLDENTGTTAADAAGGDNNGTLTNGPLWTAGRIGSALSFDGINDSVTVADSPSLDLTGALTLSAWVNPAITTTSYKTVMIKNYTYFLYASARGCGNGGILAGLSGTPARVVCDTTPLAVNTWTHLAVTYDGATVRLYRNGVLKSSAAVTGGPAVTAGTLQLGASQYGEHFKGKLDEARVYNRALSAAEVLALVNAAPTGIVTDLNGDGVTNVTDVQMAINQAAGAVACSSGDVNKDGACNVSDVQLVINRALGL
jgi:hypothetical protein